MSTFRGPRRLVAVGFFFLSGILYSRDPVQRVPSSALPQIRNGSFFIYFFVVLSPRPTIYVYTMLA